MTATVFVCFLCGVSSGAVLGLRFHVVLLNGEPRVVATSGWELVTALVLDVVGGRVQGVSLLVNADKLGHLRPDATPAVICPVRTSR